MEDKLEVIGTEEVAKAAQLLQRYKSGKAALDTRIVDNELWFRMRHWKNYKNEMMEGKPTPASADAALAALDMMDFEGIEKVRERVQQNGTLYQQLQQAMEQVQKLAGIIDQQNGSNLSAMAGAAAQQAGSAGGGSGGTSEGLSVTNGLGAQVGSGGNSLATQAARRAMDVNNPNKE